MTIIHPEAPARTDAARAHLVPVGLRRWRVVDRGGRIIGHLDDLTEGAEPRFRASRYRRASASLVSIGEFCRRDDAIDALQYAG